MRMAELILCSSALGCAGCAPMQGAGTAAADTRAHIPYEQDSLPSAYGGSGTAATVSGKDDTAPPRGDASGGLPPPRSEPDALQPPRHDDLPQRR